MDDARRYCQSTLETVYIYKLASVIIIIASSTTSYNNRHDPISGNNNKAITFASNQLKRYRYFFRFYIKYYHCYCDC